jgi:hypothetical protein
MKSSKIKTDFYSQRNGEVDYIISRINTYVLLEGKNKNSHTEGKTRRERRFKFKQSYHGNT